MTFIFYGRPDGIGNRIEQIIYIQEYCKRHNERCIYIWNNSNYRNYKCMIEFDNVTVKDKVYTEDFDLPTKNHEIFMRTPNFLINYKFTFNIKKNIHYETIIHVRATDRLNEALSRTNGDYSNKNDLMNFIRKTIDFINQSDIETYTIVSDDAKYSDLLISKINKTYVKLIYDENIPNCWMDFYYLTKPGKNVIMCSKFSSYSITASILGNVPIYVFPESLESNLNRYKANTCIIE